MALARRTLLAAAASLPALGGSRAWAAEPITAGVSGPLTGPNAQYGAQWKRGFDLALDGINGGGGVKGRPIQYVFEDSQSDPRQSVAVAQKFVANPADHHRAGGFLVARVDGRLADLPAGQAGAVRLHQLAPRLHQGRRPHVVQLHQPGGGAAEARGLRGPARVQAAGGAAPEHRLGPHGEGCVPQGRARAGDGGRGGRRLPVGRAGFPPDPGARPRQQAGRAGAAVVLRGRGADQPPGARHRGSACRSWRGRPTTRPSSSSWAARGWRATTS